MKKSQILEANMNWILAMVIGGFIGMFLGVLLISCVVVARDADERDYDTPY